MRSINPGKLRSVLNGAATNDKTRILLGRARKYLAQQGQGDGQWCGKRAGLYRESGGANAMNYRCPLGKYQLQEKMDVEAVKREGFHRQGILVVRVNDKRLDSIEREMIRRVGRKIYGEDTSR